MVRRNEEKTSSEPERNSEKEEELELTNRGKLIIDANCSPGAGQFCKNI